MKTKLSIGAFALALIVLVACAGAPPTPTAAPTTVPPTAVPTRPPAPTPAPATPTATLPPPTAAPTAKPTIEPGPEVAATKISDIVGVWFYRTRSGSGKVFDSTLEFTKEGTYHMVYDSGGGVKAIADEGKFSFEGGQLKLASTQPCQISPTKMEPCIGTYLAFVRKQGDKPVQLRFTIVEDRDRDRSITLQREFPLVEP